MKLLLMKCFPVAWYYYFLKDLAVPTLHFAFKFLDPSLPVLSHCQHSKASPSGPGPPFFASLPCSRFVIQSGGLCDALHEGHRIITQSLMMLKIAFNESCFWLLLEAFSLARETFSSFKSFTFGDFYSIGRVV